MSVAPDRAKQSSRHHLSVPMGAALRPSSAALLHRLPACTVPAGQEGSLNTPFNTPGGLRVSLLSSAYFSFTFTLRRCLCGCLPSPLGEAISCWCQSPVPRSPFQPHCPSPLPPWRFQPLTSLRAPFCSPPAPRKWRCREREVGGGRERPKLEAATP